MFSPPHLHGGPQWAGMQVGLLGGSFNPAHDGHLHISVEALKRLNLDAVWWLVSPQNPLKSKKDMAPLDARIQSAQAIAKHPRIVVTAIETDLDTRYTADTLDKLRRHFPQTDFTWMMGTDNLQQIHRWEKWQMIFDTVPVAVFDRPPAPGLITNCPAMIRYGQYKIVDQQIKNLARRAPPAWTVLHTKLNDQSATKIRAQRKPRKSLLRFIRDIF